MFLLKEHCPLGNKDILVLGVIEIISISFLEVSHELALFYPIFQLVEVVSPNVGKAPPNLNNLNIKFLPFLYLICVSNWCLASQSRE